MKFTVKKSMNNCLLKKYVCSQKGFAIIHSTFLKIKKYSLYSPIVPFENSWRNIYNCYLVFSF